MKKCIFILIMFIFSSICYGVENLAQIKNSDKWWEYEPTTFTTITFSCGKGEIRISLDTGEVTLKDRNPSEVSKHLWEGLKPYFEQHMKEICKEQKGE